MSHAWLHSQTLGPRTSPVLPRPPLSPWAMSIHGQRLCSAQLPDWLLFFWQFSGIVATVTARPSPFPCLLLATKPIHIVILPCLFMAYAVAQVFGSCVCVLFSFWLENTATARAWMSGRPFVHLSACPSVPVIFQASSMPKFDSESLSNWPRHLRTQNKLFS